MRYILIILLLLWMRVAIADVLPTTQPLDGVPQVIVLDELKALYEPVPFDHLSHAKMSEMWGGCETCHHRTPSPQTPSADLPSTRTQDDSAAIPRCRECHPASAKEAEMRVPSLKGAYHRHCLNCHREWTGENDCVVCHAPVQPAVATTAPAKDDIIGRMHPPIPEPPDTYFRARFTPVAGANVMFRHQEHAGRFGIRCAICHRRDNCADCHSATASTGSASARPRPLKPGRTWRESHAPCMSCHQKDKCDRCHYSDADDPPPPFEHASVGQLMDKDHADLACRQCHRELKTEPTCGDQACHQKRSVTFPVDRPGPMVKPRRITAPSIALASTLPTSRPTTRPTIVRIRRGGL